MVMRVGDESKWPKKPLVINVRTLANINNKQVRTNIGLADTFIPSSFLYLIYMGGTGPCDSIKIIFGYHGNS